MLTLFLEFIDKTKAMFTSVATEIEPDAQKAKKRKQGFSIVYHTRMKNNQILMKKCQDYFYYIYNRTIFIL